MMMITRISNWSTNAHCFSGCPELDGYSHSLTMYFSFSDRHSHISISIILISVLFVLAFAFFQSLFLFSSDSSNHSTL